MIDAAIAVLISLLVYWVMGLGPALALTRGPRRWEFAIAAAGPVGMVLTVLAGTVLVRLDLPVERWAWPWALAMGLVSLAGTAGFYLRSQRRQGPALAGDAGTAPGRQNDEPLNRGFLSAFLVATALALVLIVAPIVIGGIQYTAMRYHRFDAFNYLEMARYVNSQPVSWILHATRQALIDRDALYLGTQGFLTGRYATAILMAWVAKLGGVPVARVEYASGLIYLVLAIGPVMSLGAMAGLRAWSNCLLGLAVSVGFWGLCIQDARFESQINAIPIVCLIAVAAARLEESSPMMRLRGRWPAVLLVALAVAALVPLYPEILALVIPGLGLFVLFRAWQTGNWWRAPATIAGTVLAGLGLGCVAWPNFVGFMKDQAAWATGTHATFEVETFRWLFAAPWRDYFTGSWGLALFLRPGTAQFPGVTVLGAAATMAAIGVTLVFLWSVVQGLRKGNIAATVVLAMALSALGLFVFFLAMGHKWVAGRGLGYGYMFLFMGVAFALPLLRGAGSPGLAPRGLPRFQKYGRGLAVGLVGAWLIVEGLVVPAYRVNLARTGSEAENYLILTERNNTGLGYYMRAVDYDARPLERALDKAPGAALGIALNNAWYSDYFALALGDHHAIFDFCGIRDRNLDDYQREIVARQPLENPPEFLLVAQHSPLLHLVASAHRVAENRDFVLLRREGPSWAAGGAGGARGSGVAVLATSPDAQPDPRGRPAYRLDRQTLRITLVNLGSQPISLGLRGDVEPVNPERESLPAEIAIELDRPLGIVTVGPATHWKLWVPLQIEPGVQTILVEVSEAQPQKEYWLSNIGLVRVGPG